LTEREPVQVTTEVKVGRSGGFTGIHIAFVVNVDWFFLSHRLPLAEEARRLGATVSIIAGETEAAARIRALGFPFYPLPIVRAGRNPLSELGTYRALIRYYEALRPDLVHHVSMKAVVYGSLAAKRTRVPAVVNAVSGLGSVLASRSSRWSLSRTLLMRLLRLAVGDGSTHLILQNPDDRRLFQERVLAHDARVFTVSGSGVATSQFSWCQERTEGPLQVVLPARMLWSKGVGEFVQAAREIKRDCSFDVRFLLAGPLDLENPDSIPESTLREWTEEGAVTWLGEVEEMASLLADTHLVVLPSYYGEGVPKALIEGAARGRALVAADSPGCREIVRAGINGLLVEPQDPEALAAAITDLLIDGSRRKTMGVAGCALVKRQFELRTVIDATMDIYRTALSNGDA
jgi:glycosyltransferase involved in cell wall biosynthesis